MNITVNGNPMDVPHDLMLTDLMRQLDLRPGMTVVERNGVIVGPDDLAATQLGSGDVLELVRLVGGG